MGDSLKILYILCCTTDLYTFSLLHANWTIKNNSVKSSCNHFVRAETEWYCANRFLILCKKYFKITLACCAKFYFTSTKHPLFEAILQWIETVLHASRSSVVVYITFLPLVWTSALIYGSSICAMMSHFAIHNFWNWAKQKKCTRIFMNLLELQQFSDWYLQRNFISQTSFNYPYTCRSLFCKNLIPNKNL